MCKVYNTVGSLTALKTHLESHNVKDFSSVKELINFQRNFPISHEQIIAHHRQVILKETEKLSAEIPQLQDRIEAKRGDLEHSLASEQNILMDKINKLDSHRFNVFQGFVRDLKKLAIKFRSLQVKRSFNKQLVSSLAPLIAEHQSKEARFDHITTEFECAVNISAEQELRVLVRKRNIIDQVNNFIYGAIGEQKVVKALENLPDNYGLINDLTLEFHPAIYHNNGYIKSVQIDHVLVSPSGIFLIETKNWSQDSMENLDLHSPVQQIKRTNYALYKLLNKRISNSRLNINSHHWGDRKIPIRNLIVLIRHKPPEEFQHVKILTLNEMQSYVTYFQPSMSDRDVKIITDELMRLNRSLVSI